MDTKESTDRRIIKSAKGSRHSYLTDEENKKKTKTSRESRLSYLTDDENRRMKPRAEKILGEEEEKTRCKPKRIQAKRLYFSDLTEEQVMGIFDEGPRFRFELCSVVVNYKTFGKQPKLFGFIQAAERPGSLTDGLSPDPASRFVVSKIFHREYYDPLVVPNTGPVDILQNICFCAIQTTRCVQISAELYVTTEKGDDVENIDDYYNEVEKYDDSLVSCEDNEEDNFINEEEDIENDDSNHNIVYRGSDESSDEFVYLFDDSSVSGYDDEEKGKVTTTEKEENHNEVDNDKVSTTEKEKEEDVCKLFDHYEIDHSDSWFLKGKKDDLEKDNDYHNDVEEEEEDIENEAFEVCNEHASIDMSDCLAQRPFGSSGYNIFKGQDGSLELYYVLLKYSIDVSLEVDFVATSSKAPKVYGWVSAYYGKNFDYGDLMKHLCKALLFETEPDEFVKPGKLKLMRSVLPVPVQFSLIISAYLHDSSGDIVLMDSCEFPVPRDGSSSFKM